MLKIRAFTLMEVVVVVVILGILATFALPGYQKAVEKTKVKKAKQVLNLAYSGAILFKDDPEGGDGVLDPGGVALTIGMINDYVELGGASAKLTNGTPVQTNDVAATTMFDFQEDWIYSVDLATGDDLLISAKRLSGKYQGCTIIIDKDQDMQVGTTADACAE